MDPSLTSSNLSSSEHTSYGSVQIYPPFSAPTTFFYEVPLYAPIPVSVEPPQMFSDLHYFIEPAPSPIEPSYEPLQTFPTLSQLLANQSQLETFTEEQGLGSRSNLLVVKDMPNFTALDPENISAHEKKRFYLECLERYVIYLHDQLNLIGVEPLPIERVTTGHGLSSRSIRTLVVHMQHTAQKINMRRDAEEQQFLYLRDTVLLQEQQNSSEFTYNQQEYFYQQPY
ncbi:hypothetical protein C8J56DRAFT_308250 [Mycena floridula]|nr:hypothetical protein C8J56DRAFT_308250 [Mycena floridula]